MARQAFEVHVHIVVEIELDETLVPDDEWREFFYDIHDLAGMAKHIVWNKVIQEFSSVEGLAPEDMDKFKILSVDKNITECWQLSGDSDGIS